MSTEEAKESLKAYGMLALVGAGVIGIGGFVHYSSPPPMPPPPPVEKKPEAPRPEVQIRFTPAYFKSLIAEDARRFGVGATLQTISEPFRYFNELSDTKILSVGESFSTDHLTISAKIERHMAGSVGLDHLVLHIKNKTGNHIAYRVLSDVPDERACRRKGATPHNAIALKPHEETARTECVYQSGVEAIVQKVEVMEIPSLSYYYVSRLHPPQALYGERSSEGHQPAMGKTCELVPWRDIRTQSEAGETTWADVIDYYARHNCDEYNFFRGYKQRKRPDEPLPANIVEADPSRPK